MLMAAEVSSLVRLMSRFAEEEKGDEEAGRDLVTRDLLGGCSPAGSKGLDLDGWEKRLDLAGQPGAPVARGRRLQDLNFPPVPTHELKLFPLSSSSSVPFPPVDYQSVCTLDKVRSALDRLKCRNASPSPASSSTTTASAKRRHEEEEGDGESRSSVEEVEPPASADRGGRLMVAAGCPSCLSYVLVSGRNPRCPRCGAAVPTAVPKRRRLDLNLAAGGGQIGKKDGNL